MARLETSSNLVGKTITLLNGTKAKIVDAITSGYKTDKSAKRIATRCVIKKGTGYAEIERMPLTQLVDTGEGYVEIKSADSKAPAKKSAAKSTAKASTKTATKTSAKSSTKAAAKADSKPAAKAKAPAKTKAAAKKEEAEAPRSRVRRKSEQPTTLTAIDQEFTEALVMRVVEHLKSGNLLSLATDGVTPIDNAFEVTYDAQYAAPNQLQFTIGVEYAMPQQAAANDAVEISAEVLERAAKKVGKTIGKKLAAAIKSAYGVDSAKDLLAGTVLRHGDDEFIYIGASAADADKAYMYNAESDKFRAVAAANLSSYELVADEEQDEDEEEEEEDDNADLDFEDDEEEEADDEEAEEEEEEEAEEEDGDDEESEPEYSYRSISKDELSLVNKKVTAKYVAQLAEQWSLDVEALVPGLIVSDGETEFAYVGFDSKGGLVVIDTQDGEAMVYAKAQVKSLTEFAAVLGDDETSDEEEEEVEDEEEAEEEDGDDDFDFDDADSADLDDMSEDELRDKVIQAGLTTVRKAGRMNEDELRELLAD